MKSARSVIPESLVALAIVASACLGGPDHAPDSGVLEPYPDSPTVIVAGYVWDPEIVQYSFGMCGPACSLRPLTMPGQTYFERSLVSSAQVELSDLQPGSVPYATIASDAGTWMVSEVRREPEPFLYSVAWKARNGSPPDAGGSDAGASDGGPRDGGASDAGFDAGDPDAGNADAGDTDAGFDAGAPDAGFDAGLRDAGASDGGRPDGGSTDGGSTDGGTTDAGPPAPFLGPVPISTTYFATVSITPPISPHLFQCVGRPAAVIGNAGILESVAKFLTNTGRPTLAADFVDPSRFGGVIIWWAYASGGATTRQGASGVAFTASEGELIHVNWACPAGPGVTCPPGAPIPPPGLPSKSARNFFVMPGATASNIGIAVLLLPPSGSAQTVSFTVTDPVVDATRFRPYAFRALPQVTAIPGKIQFGQTQGLPQLTAEPAGYECLPEQ